MAYLGTKPANAVLTSEQIGDGVIATADLANGAVTQAKLGTNVAGTGVAFSASMSADQTVTSATSTKITFNTEVFDTASCYDNTTNYRFTPNVAGYYQINLTANLGSTTTSVSLTNLNIYKNGSAYIGTRTDTLSSSVGSMQGTLSTLVYMNGTTDYLEAYVYITAGGTPTIGKTYSSFNGYLARAA